jgi:hypothetical protein
MGMAVGGVVRSGHDVITQHSPALATTQRLQPPHTLLSVWWAQRAFSFSIWPSLLSPPQLLLALFAVNSSMGMAVG